MDDFDFSIVRRTSPVCFNSQCLSKDHCLRYLAGLHAPDGVEVHLCVMPKAIKGERCRMYQKIQTVRVAYGFSRSFDALLKRDDTPIRKALVKYLGCKRSYYWYLRGEKPLMPEQQAWIENLFRQRGYEGGVIYDRMDDIYVLDSVAY